MACRASEYYLGVGEAPGRWHGRGLAELGLEPGAVVSERELEALFARGLHPTAGTRLGRAWRSDGVTGFDLTFSTPKSVSAVWALGDSSTAAEVMAAHRAAVRASLGYLDAHASLSRCGTDGVQQVSSNGLAAALPERMVDPLFDAATGLRVVRSSYERSPGVEHRTASRDLQVLSDQGLLIPVGEKRGRWYHGSPELRALHREARAGRKPIAGPLLRRRAPAAS